MIKQAAAALLLSALAVGALSGGIAAPGKPAPPAKPVAAVTASIPMKKDGGVYVVPVSVNGVTTFECIVDSGASDVNIPANVFQKLLRSGTVKESDFVGTQEYTLADGSTQRGRTYRIKSLKVGNMVVNNVVASVGGDESSGLLGQSFLERFRSWSLNNTNHTLVLTGPPTAAPAPGRAGHPPITGPRPQDGGGVVAQGGPSNRLPPTNGKPPRATPPAATGGSEPATIAQAPSERSGRGEPSGEGLVGQD